MEVVRSTCPGCTKSLNIPAEWAGKTVKCKFCGHAMLVRAKSGAVASPAIPVAMAAAPVPTWEALPEDAPVNDDTVPNYPSPAVQAPRSSYVSAFDTRDKYSGRGEYSGPKNRGWLKYAVLGVCFTAMAAGAGVLAVKYPNLFRSGTTEPVVANNGGGTTTITTTTPTHNPGEGNVAGAFPRRMLAISIHSYLYANPIHNGDSGFALDDNKRTGTDAAIRRLAERWKIPKDQLYHLTDARQAGEKKEDKKAGKVDAMGKKEEALVAAPVGPAKAIPLKIVIEGSIEKFLESSREQDRIVLMFCGHAIERKGEAYLVPIEGDLEELESLIPLKWFYDKLGACKAQEKIVLFDVCRFHPTRGIERPAPGPMTEAMEKALHEPPAGVTVVTSCSKGQQALELDYVFNKDFRFDSAGVKGSGIELHGSFFLSMMHVASMAGALAPDKKLPAATDEIPVERLTEWMAVKLAQVVKDTLPDQTQTVKATIKRAATNVAPDAAEPLPARFNWPTPPPSADPKAVMAIVREVQLPPIKSFRDDAAPPSISDILPFSEEALKDFLAGEIKLGEKGNEFQLTVIEAVEEMRKIRSAGSGSELPEEFGGDTNDKAKELLRKVQEVPARVEAILQDSLDKLEAAEFAEMREKQAKRWQLHYDYVIAQLRLRICYVNQYNLALANVRGGKLPDLKEGQNGFRLTAESQLDKNTPANYKDMFNEARKTLNQIAKDHPKTPWALLAKSDRTVTIGLRLTGDTIGSIK